ncbi:ABC transporter permease subunit [Actinomadura graeca]|uniref:ABC transporter permease subunit n=1 Tax=Actinomadura graeca TaxID=2750812 RepID=A0ABX8QZA1_9ACTN|nr:ABC transporter permease subunit [Actinomadura graeca]QXJ24134.1 ABC transporter permease subunit [Actinomadura graeca]
MIWLTLRQFRVQALIAAGGLAVLAAVLTATGPGLSDDYANGLAACTAQGDCTRFSTRFFDERRAYFFGLASLVIVVPGLIGAFWGAPIITRELESGTHRLVWNQSVSRTRWLSVKLGLVAAVAMAAAGLACLAVALWSDPLDEAAGKRLPRLSPLMFDARGIAPIGYAAFAFALGVTVGVLVRRTLPAMAITLAVFALVQIAVPQLVRPDLIPPKRATITITPENVNDLSLTPDGMSVSAGLADPEAWTLSSHTVDASGRQVRWLPRAAACQPPAVRPADGKPPGPDPRCFAEIARLGYRQQITYHPGSRFWALQWRETGLFALIAAGLSGFCFFWVRRRLS